MIELLRRAAEAQPDHVAVVNDERSITYRELTRWAETIADALEQQGITRFALSTRDATTAIALLAGSSLAGAEACQYSLDDGPAEIAAMLDRFDHRVLVSDRAELAGLRGVMAVEQLETPNSDSRRAAHPVPSTSRPLMVLTTGTTGTPRGARHDWNRLLTRMHRTAMDRDQRWLLAYGTHQYAGVQILMHVMALGATLVAPSERRPKDALAAMRAHNVGYVSATPTWWRFFLAELSAEGGAPPPLLQITLGGEAVSESLLAQLADALPDASRSQIYGATEFGLTGSVRDGHNGLHVSILHRGDEAPVQLRVVEGQLWVRSRIGMLGYYGEPEVDPDEWRATGDLVEIVGDRIHFRGRVSEVINVGGVKVHPLAVEELVSSIPGVGLARVFGRPNAMTGAIVAVEVVPAPGADVEVIDAAIRDACARLAPAMRPRSIQFVEGLTVRGGKLSRVASD